MFNILQITTVTSMVVFCMGGGGCIAFQRLAATPH
jgi:hypothetical protein